MFYVTNTYPERVGAYKAYNTTTIPDVEGGSAGSDLPWSAFSPAWAYDDAFYVMFVPVNPIFRGSVLGCLALDFVVIEAHERGYQLSTLGYHIS